MQLGAGWAQASAAAAVVRRSASGSEEAESQTDRKLRRVRDPPVQTTALLLLNDVFVIMGWKARDLEDPNGEGSPSSEHDLASLNTHVRHSNCPNSSICTSMRKLSACGSL
jgi:hypothetical protein